MDSVVRAEVTTGGGNLKGDWNLPDNMAHSISSFVRVGLMSVLGSCNPGLTLLPRNSGQLDLPPSPSGILCIGLPLLALDMLAPGLSPPSRSLTHPGPAVLAQDFQSLDFSLPSQGLA